MFIQASSENRPYTRPRCVKHWDSKTKNPARRAVCQHSHNCVRQCDSAGMDSVYRRLWELGNQRVAREVSQRR